jgi:hypothetical protein
VAQFSLGGGGSEDSGGPRRKRVCVARAADASIGLNAAVPAASGGPQQPGPPAAAAPRAIPTAKHVVLQQVREMPGLCPVVIAQIGVSSILCREAKRDRVSLLPVYLSVCLSVCQWGAEVTLRVLPPRRTPAVAGQAAAAPTPQNGSLDGQPPDERSSDAAAAPLPDGESCPSAWFGCGLKAGEGSARFGVDSGLLIC